MKQPDIYVGRASTHFSIPYMQRMPAGHYVLRNAHVGSGSLRRNQEKRRELIEGWKQEGLTVKGKNAFFGDVTQDLYYKFFEKGRELTTIGDISEAHNDPDQYFFIDREHPVNGTEGYFIIDHDAIGEYSLTHLRVLMHEHRLYLANRKIGI